MSFRDPKYSGGAARAADRHARMREAAAAREAVKEASEVEYNDSGKRQSVVQRILARLGRGDREG